MAPAHGFGRRENSPCPGLRPGRLGFFFRSPLENGAALRLFLRRSSSFCFCKSSICRCSSRIKRIRSARQRESRSSMKHSVPIPFYTQVFSCVPPLINYEFTNRYDGLLRHSRMTGQKIQAGKANENGDIEQRHHRLKRAIDQALMLRGRRDFASVEDYKQFLRLLLAQLKAGRRDRLKVEMQYRRALPERRLESAQRVSVKVDSGSIIYLDRNVYSVNSRLIGEQVEARLSAETVEVWYAGQKVELLPRLRGRGKHRVDYRHIIDWLVRKPGAFENYRYREELFPTSRFRMAWDALRELVPARANKRYLEILQLAAQEGEVVVDEALRAVLEQGEIGEGKLNVEALRLVLAQEAHVLPVTDVAVAEVALASFDELLGGNATGVTQ